jgi:hypothetical protein
LKEISKVAGILERNVSEFIREAALKEARLASAGIEATRDQVFSKGDNP